jgi:uncharacterized membrane protein YbhN (UPF0104 family)
VEVRAAETRAVERLSDLFGAVPTGTVRRGASDVVRVTVAGIALLGLTLYAGTTPNVEERLADLVDHVPGAVDRVFELLWYLGSVVSVVVMVGLALAFRKWRLTASMVVAGVAAFLLSIGLAAVTDLGPTRTADFGDQIAWPGYPNVRLAVTTAVLLSASPFLTRPARTLIRFTLLVSAVSAGVLIDGLTSDVAAALVIGWGMAAGARLAFGFPVGEPTPAEISSGLRRLGVAVVEVQPTPRERWGVTRLTARTEDGTDLAVSAFGRDDTDGQLLAKLRRKIWMKDSGPELSMTRLQAVEHLALLLLLAERAGVAVPRLVTLGRAGPRDDALVVTAPPPGVAVSVLDPANLTDDVLADLWRNLNLLHSAGLTYGQMGPDDVLVTGDGRVALVAFERASVSSSPERRAADRAEALVTTAAFVGPQRAVDAAMRALGTEGLEQVQPLLQPVALSPAARRLVRADRTLLRDLQALTTEATGTAPPDLVQLRRVSPRHLVLVAATLFGLYLVLTQLAGINDLAATLRSASWDWVVVAFVLAFCTNVTSAVALAAAAPQRMPLGPTTAVEVANNFTALIGGAVASLALNIRYFQRRGFAAAVAISSGVLSNLAGIVIQCSLVLICLPLTQGHFQVSGVGGGGHAGLVLLVVIVLGVAVSLVLFVPRVRSLVTARLGPQLASLRVHLGELFRSPRRITALLGGQLGSHVLFALVLGAALHAYGESLDLATLILINELATALATVIPVPGGIGVMEASLIAGFTAFGVPQSEAAAAAITARMATFYIPPIWGWGAFVWLGRNEYI